MDDLIALMEPSQASKPETPAQSATPPTSVDTQQPFSKPESAPTKSDPQIPPSAEHFMLWLKHAIVARKLVINDAKALVHTVDGTA